MQGGPMPGAPMPGGHMPGQMFGQMGGAPPQGGYAPYGGGYPGAYGAPPPAANDPMWGYFTAIAGQVCASSPGLFSLRLDVPGQDFELYLQFSEVAQTPRKMTDSDQSTECCSAIRRQF